MVAASRFRLAVVLAAAAILVAPGQAAHSQGEPLFCFGEPVTLVGTEQADNIHATAGRDVIRALGGDDRIDGRAGDDVICGDGGRDRMAGGPGDDTLSDDSPGFEEDVLVGGSGNDGLFAGLGDDLLEGGPGDDVLRGGSADDEDFDPGEDELVGGPGADFLDGGLGEDKLAGGDGDDTLQGGIHTDFVHGGAGDDDLSGDFGDDRLSGASGDDTIRGDIGDDVIHGGTGDDELLGSYSPDDESDTGHDVLAGGAGTDLLYGAAGNDDLEGGSGGDLIEGGAGDDRLAGNPGDDRLRGGAGDDRLDGGEGDDELSGGEGNDRLVGGPGADRLLGEDGDDRLSGGAGNDVLEGGPGNDALDGGPGRDRLDQEGQGTLGALVAAGDRAGVRAWAATRSIATINAAVAALGQSERDELAAVVLDSNATGSAREQILRAMRTTLAHANLGFYAEVWSYTFIELTGDGFFGGCNHLFLSPSAFTGLSDPDTVAVLMHESLHSFNCVNGGPVGSLDEGSAIWIHKLTFGPPPGPGESWAEATYGSKLFHKEFFGNPNLPIVAPLNPTTKLLEVFQWLAANDPSHLPWNSTERLVLCFERYFQHLNRNVDFVTVWLPAVQAATEQMLADPDCRPL